MLLFMTDVSSTYEMDPHDVAAWAIIFTAGASPLGNCVVPNKLCKYRTC
jgi:hypothetical protein